MVFKKKSINQKCDFSSSIFYFFPLLENIFQEELTLGRTKSHARVYFRLRLFLRRSIKPLNSFLLNENYNELIKRNLSFASTRLLYTQYL